MSLSNTTENDLMLLLFNATALSWNANTSLYIALHTADPGEAGTATTSESAYTGYARVTVARSAGGFTVSGNSVSNTATITFPVCTGSTSAVTYFSIVTTASGAGQIVASGALSSTLNVAVNIVPLFNAGQLTGTFD